jgi:hypothetical protein
MVMGSDRILTKELNVVRQAPLGQCVTGVHSQTLRSLRYCENTTGNLS